MIHPWKPDTELLPFLGKPGGEKHPLGHWRTVNVYLANQKFCFPPPQFFHRRYEKTYRAVNQFILCTFKEHQSQQITIHDRPFFIFTFSKAGKITDLDLPLAGLVNQECPVLYVNLGMGKIHMCGNVRYDITICLVCVNLHVHKAEGFSSLAVFWNFQDGCLQAQGIKLVVFVYPLVI